MAGSPFAESPASRCVPPSGSTKRRLLALLKRRAALTVDELATALSVASMTVRQHLTALERDGLVLAEEWRNGPGRPRHLYRLTEAGNAVFLDHYDQIALALLREVSELDSAEIAGLTAPQKRDLILARVAAREAERHTVRLATLPLPRRVDAVIELLQSGGGIAEYEVTAQGFEIRDFNCSYRRLAPGQPVCVWHLSLLSHLLAVPVHAAAAAGAKEAVCCRFVAVARTDTSPGRWRTAPAAAIAAADFQVAPLDRLP